MGDLPERIWVADGDGNCRVGFSSPSLDYKTPYILDTPEALAASPEVQKLVAEAEARANKAHEKEIAVWSENYAALEARCLAAETTLQGVNAMLMDGQGDDEGPQIMPVFDENDSIETRIEACLHLLEKRRDVIAAHKLEGGAASFDRADWFWRAMDPDDCGDSPEEAINRAMVGRFCVCEIASSYAGPTRYGFIAPVLDPESDDEEFIHFATQQEAIEEAKRRAEAAAIRRAEGEPT